LERVLLLSEQTEDLGQLGVEVIEKGPIDVIFDTLDQGRQWQWRIETYATLAL